MAWTITSRYLIFARDTSFGGTLGIATVARMCHYHYSCGLTRVSILSNTFVEYLVIVIRKQMYQSNPALLVKRHFIYATVSNKGPLSLLFS